MRRDQDHPQNSAGGAPEPSLARQRWVPSSERRPSAGGATQRWLTARRLLLAATLLAALALSASCLAAQSPPQDPPKPKAKPNSTTDNATQNASDQPTWDPLRAEKDIEVGQYYLRKGDFDAAIDRFQDATLAKPGYAIPFRYLGEAQEKKKLKRDALKSYTRYLDLYPHAEDRDKIEKKIAKLRADLEKSKK
jgi:tetratricopeptide (TPR) repeat protein